tara:strand:- start:399 stop:746 length:348 start_codon:yes stop_codon:yes gene_type:complete
MKIIRKIIRKYRIRKSAKEWEKRKKEIEDFHAGRGGENITREDISDLRSMDLRGQDLSGDIITWYYMRGSIWDENTIWPKGFEPPHYFDSETGEILMDPLEEALYLRLIESYEEE